MFMEQLWQACCLMLQNSKVYGVQPCEVPEVEYKSPVYSSALCNNIFMRIWIFLSTSLKRKYQNRLNPSNNFRVALSNCVSRYGRIISEKQQ